MRENPKPHELFTHFKGNKYQIVTLAENSEDGSTCVVYQAMYGEFKTYVRPLAMFMSEVDHDKYPEVKQKYRFARESELGEVWEDTSDSQQAAEQTDAVSGSFASADRRDTDTPSEAWQMDPEVEAFLDAGSAIERLRLLSKMHLRLTDDMINMMAIAIDVVIDEGPLEKRYGELKVCLEMKAKYEKIRY